MNTPLKPAIDFGVDRVVILATHAVDPCNDSNWHTEGSPPDFGDGAVQLLFAASGQTPHRQIPYMFIAPPSRDRLGDLATEVFADNFAGLTGFLHSRNIATLARLLGGISEPHGELLSYLLFAPEFTPVAIEQGERDARVWLERDWGSDGPWLVEPISVLDGV